MRIAFPSARFEAAPRRPRSSCVALILVLSITFIIPVPASLAQGSSMRTESFALKPGGQVRVENARGSTTVETWDGNTVRIVAEKIGRVSPSLDRSELILMAAQNTILVQTKDSSQPGRINLMLYVPHRAHLQVAGGTWPIDVTGALASAIVESTSGNVTYKPPANDNARIIARSVRGLVRSTLPLAVSSRAGARSIQGQIGTGGGEIFLGSQSGNITLAPGPLASPDVIAMNVPAPDSSNGGQNQSYDREQPQTVPGQPRSNNPGHAAYQQPLPADDTDASSIAVPPSQRGSAGNQGNTSQGGTVVFGGHGRDSSASRSERAGPLTRNRERSDESVGSAGIGVRIIPSNQPLGSSRQPNQQTQDDATANGQSNSQTGRPPQSGYSLPDKNTNRPGYPYDDPPDNTRRNQEYDPLPEPADRSRSTAPPVLRRNGEEDKGKDASPTSPSSSTGENKEDEESVKLNSSLVNLNVSATNRSGVAIGNLSKEDFAIYENGEKQEVEFFAPSSAPFNLVLVLDLSGSIKEKLDVVKAAALKFVDSVGKNDKVAVLTFTDQVRVVSQLTENRELVKKRIKAIERPDGGTAFYEAMWFALTDTLRGTRGQRNAIVVMTDGVDSSMDRNYPSPTRVTFERLAQRLEESDALVFPIYLDTEYDDVYNTAFNNLAEVYAIARMQLERLAEITGGTSYRAEQVGDLGGVYKQIILGLRTIYSVGYYPTKSERDGTYRRVQVRVDRSDVAVRSRRGYYAK